MKDITSTSFGLVIAYLLPGLAGLGGMAFFSPEMAGIAKLLLSANSDAGLFLLVVLAGLALGLQVTLFRWVLFERWVCKGLHIDPKAFENLSEESKLLAFKAVVDEHYRYHQFWGGMFLVHFILYPGMVCEFWTTRLSFFISLAVFIGAQIVLFMGTVASYKLYVIRAKKILEGD